MKKSKSIAELNRAYIKKFKTADQTRAQFPIGTAVRVIIACSDFRFFRGTEEGVVRPNPYDFSKDIYVVFNEPMVYQDGYKHKAQCFEPHELKILKVRKTVCPTCGK